MTGPSKAYQTSKVLATRPRNRFEYEKDTPVIPSKNFDAIQLNNLEPAAQFSRLRVLVLMDLDNGLVRWESNDDSENPQCVSTSGNLFICERDAQGSRNSTWGRKWMLGFEID
jgi:hypothetical protein